MELWKVPKFLDGSTLLLSLSSVAAIVVGYAIGVLVRGRSRKSATSLVQFRSLYAHNRQSLRKLFFWTLNLTWIAAAIWLAGAVSQGLRPSDIKSLLLQQAASSLKDDYFVTGAIPGVTSLTQLGMAGVIVGFLVFRLENRRKTKWALIGLLSLNAVRALLLSERVALIEVAVPAVVLFVHFKIHAGISRRLKTIITLAPIAGLVLLFLVFTGSEMFRSWTYYSSRSDSNIFEFGAARLMGYYLTAVNNSGLILTRVSTSFHAPVFTQEWLWKMPVLGKAMGDASVMAMAQYRILLKANANLEFNNPGGILLPLWDFGITGGLFYWLAFGFVISKIYQSFRRGGLAGLLLYPLVYVGLLELSRLLYLSDSRCFPSLVILASAALLLGYPRRVKQARPAQVRRPSVVAPNAGLASTTILYK
ncbi:MAG TPA: O-antigen polymerase [Edaphobacter sp.]|nr:O-antigen polymerase [Edaphobacter sp.]